MLESDDQTHYLSKQIQNQGHKLELHKLLSLLVDQAKVVRVEVVNFLQNSKMENLHKKMNQLPRQHLTCFLESPKIFQAKDTGEDVG